MSACRTSNPMSSTCTTCTWSRCRTETRASRSWSPEALAPGSASRCRSSSSRLTGRWVSVRASFRSPRPRQVACFRCPFPLGCPMPMCSGSRRPSASWSALQPHPEQEHRAEVTPPVDEGPCPRIGLALLRIGDSDGDFHPGVAADERLGEEVGLHLVATQPYLVDVDPRVVKELQPIGLVAAGRV